MLDREFRVVRFLCVTLAVLSVLGFAALLVYTGLMTHAVSS
jgi:hypothetical protein